MKLRIRGDSLRLRLTRTEVEALASAGKVEDEIAFGSSHDERLVYALERSVNATAVAAGLSRGRVTVVVPDAVAHAWASGDAVGFEGVQGVGDGRSLRILVEKDWRCLAPRETEDDDDAFPHPKAPS